MPPFAAAVAVSDLGASLRWYRSTLGFRAEEGPAYPRDGAPYATLEREGFRLELVDVRGAMFGRGMPNAHARIAVPGLYQIAYVVPDLDAAVRRVGAFGTILPASRLLHAPVVDHAWGGGVRYATVTDPDGVVVQLIERLSAERLSA